MSQPYDSGVPEEFVPRELSEVSDSSVLNDVLAPGRVSGSRLSRRRYLRTLARPAADVNETPAEGATFWAHLWTTKWRPAHEITIRCAEAGWTRDIHGLYRYGGWHFELPKSVFPDGLTMKFVLNGHTWIKGFDRQLAPDKNHHFTAEEDEFDSLEERFVVPYGDFRAEATRQQQEISFGNVNSAIHYDVIVVGSGMGGGILADQLSDRGAKTLLLEIGSLGPSTHINNLPGDWESLPQRNQVLNFENKDDSKFLYGVQMTLGGRSVFWSGLIPRMREWELQYWPQDVSTYLCATGYLAAEALLRKRQTLGPFQNQVVEHLAACLPGYKVIDLPRSQHQPNLAADGSSIGDVIETSTGTFSTADLLLDSLGHAGRAGRDNLTVNLQHRVVRVESTGEQSAVVECQDLAGNVGRRYTGKYVVLCAGSIESPRIALQSNLQDPNKKIGRGLTDHPAYFSHGGTDYGYMIPQTQDGGVPHPFWNPAACARVLIQPKANLISEQPFNTELLLNGWYWDLRHADDDLRQQWLNLGESRVKFQFNFSSQLDDTNWLALQGDDQPIALRVAPNESGSAFHEQCKNLRNRLLEELDIPNPEPNSNLGYANQGTPHHAGGSLRMSGDGTGVVDTNLKFEAYPNLYACDVSVFPAIPAANPSLTLAALSLRLADHLASRLNP
ncbi:GMC oxidoreductase [Nocardia abscessus]|uniref:GMC oxidoreductase n=1 Tax=Nocardia abscessus TaxID=120957 RepID=UPI000306E5E6|nr:GMC oxidoreductase [Nocardia abscessus]MCC3328269.1 GMC family oxidoreductase N-terminal domain-containing protein [Nocardia abscessus]